MILCVGAASQRVVEEAAKLRVHQIVASRRQVGEFSPGYTGYTSASLVEAVRELSGGATRVVRDHGGPYQNGSKDDDWTAALDADADAGFHGLHLDVCHLPSEQQAAELTRLCERYDSRVEIEVGGERNSGLWLRVLLEAARKVCRPYAAIGDFGGYIHADRQCGTLVSPSEAGDIADLYASAYGVIAKAHNLDWTAGRRHFVLDGLYNVAPEFGNVEVDAWLHVLPWSAGQGALNFAYGTRAWERWFGDGEGTVFERARAALRYHLNTPAIAGVLARYDDTYVREMIADAIQHG